MRLAARGTAETRQRVRRAAQMAVLGLLLGLRPAGSDGPGGWEDDDHSYDRARRAVNRGEALSLAEVKRHLQETAPGEIVATEYEFEFGRWVYEFKIVDPQGRLRKVHLDAKTGELIRISDD